MSLKDKFAMTPALKDLTDRLLLWEEITPFMVITTITDVNEYKNLMKKWNDNLKAFYKVGKFTFLSKNVATPGDDDIFYMHVLHFYLPQIAKKTLEDYQLGLGIWTMQGFERRNKESKHTLKRFSNNKGNVLLANLRRLWDIYYHEHTAL